MPEGGAAMEAVAPSLRLCGAPASRPRDAASRPSAPPCPPGWVTGPPDFVGVGAQRCGTTWWHRSVVAHPEIQPAAAKEFHFFDQYFGDEPTPATIDAYYKLFPRPQGKLTGEWTPRYMHDFWTPALLGKTAPQARILVMLRDPLSRYQSGRSHDVDVLLDAVFRRRRDYVDALVANDALDRSLYSRQIARLLEHFDRGQVLVLQYERCVRDPNAELRRTFEFLGVDPEAYPGQPSADRVGRGHPQLQPPTHISNAARALIGSDAERLKNIVPDLDLNLWPSAQLDAEPTTDA